MAKKKWKDLSANQKRGIVLSIVVQLVLLAAALYDIYRRPREEIRGNKFLWVLVSFVNFIGQLAYFRFGRRQ